VSSLLARASHGSNQSAGPESYRPPGETDIHLFREGTHTRLYETLGARMCQVEGVAGAAFAVWAPNAAQVAVVGDFNGWDAGACPLSPRPDGSGIWEGFSPDARLGQRYKYRIASRYNDYVVDKADPFAFHSEVPPSTASVLCNLDYEWRDNEWMTHRRRNNALDAPMSVYEVHLGSWRRKPEDNFRSLHYREIAEPLAQHVQRLGFTHVELMPLMEHPFFGSWGYQVTGFFAPSARYGSPQDLMYMIDTLHAYGIGVILDWVPSHFPDDAHGIAYFDGSYLFEHADPRQGVHPEWKSRIFNYGRNEVRAFLLSSATYWLEKFHADGLRVDGVASMLYLDYGRNAGEWIPNAFGGRENLEAVSFLRTLNESVYRDFPDVQMIAEESTAWPMVSRPIYIGGLGFGLKWNMGWMHDSLNYFGRDPIYRKFHHDQLTFGIWYAFHENFVLPLSHDEVVYGKGSLLRRMPGDEWQRFANLRLLFGFMWAHPGKKLLFMGGEFGQYAEWNHDGSLDWHLREYPLHAGVERWLGDLNAFYREHPALHQRDFSPDGFAWIDCHDAEQSVVSFLRRAADGSVVLVVCNNTPTVRENYRVGVPVGGVWHERLNSDAPLYGGSGQGNLGVVEASPVAAHGHYWSLTLRLPPLGVLYLIPDGPTEIRP
jgi:1,4-alpha-glucan branching enzyme